MADYNANNYSPKNPNNNLELVLSRDRELVKLILAIVIIASWFYLLTGAGTGMYPHKMAAFVPDKMLIFSSMPDSSNISDKNTDMSDMFTTRITWTPGYALLMFWMWWLMMIAMMLPSAAPMVLLHSSVTRKGLSVVEGTESMTTSFKLLLTTTAFIAGYLVMWGLFSLLAVVTQWVLVRGELLSTMMMSTNKLLGSGLLLAAGIWQLTPLKSMCLRHCRSPVNFLSSHWRPGASGAFIMGIKHGVFCLGCCWFLMALLFYGGVMNLIWIIGLALLVLAEKLMPAGIMFGKLTGLLLIFWGTWLGISALT